MTIIALRLARHITTLTRPWRQRPHHTPLDRMDERMLRDVGLCRLDVEGMRRMW